MSDLRRWAETSLGAARLDQIRGKGDKRVVCLLTGLIDELNEDPPDQNVVGEILAALDRLGWRR